MKTICNLDDSIWAEISKHPEPTEADFKMALVSAKDICENAVIIDQPGKRSMIKIGDKYFDYDLLTSHALHTICEMEDDILNFLGEKI